MFKKLFFSFLIVHLATVSAEEAVNLIGKKHEFFSRKNDSALISMNKKKLFKWNSSRKNEACFPADPGVKNELTFFGHPVTSAFIRFNNDTPVSICFTLFGDDKTEMISADKFRKNMMSIFTALKKRYPGCKPKIVRRSYPNGMNTNALVWKTEKYACIMKWGIKGTKATGEKPLFLQLEFEVLQPGHDPLKRLIVKTRYDVSSEKAGEKHQVKREDKGDVYLKDFPMFDQGKNGNSAAAVIQRILEFNNRKPSKPVTVTPFKKGTKFHSDVEELQLHLKKLCETHKLRMKVHYLCFDGKRSSRKLQNIVGNYNRFAKNSGRKKLDVPKGGSAAVSATFKKMDIGILADSRKDDHNSIEFQEYIMSEIMAKKPVIWYTVLGVVKEGKLPAPLPPSQMRLIIGFNNTSKEVIYTDSWGKGHELKKMSYENAWAITLATYTITAE